MIGWAEMLDNWPELRPSYNVAPSMQVAAFTHSGDNVFTGTAMRWGMVPSWANSFDSKYATFNARVETVAEKPTFRAAWKNQQRCLIPMAGYYEWQASLKGAKQPFYISDKNIGGLVAAGLYENWIDESGDHYSCTIITRPADTGLDRIHGRMPVLIKPADALDWKSVKPSDAGAFLVEVETPDIVYWPVSAAVGNTRNNGPELLEPLD